MFKINRKQLSDELALLQTVAEKKGTIPVLAYVLFQFDGETLTVTGTDIDTSLVTEIPASGEAWSGCVPLRQLYDLCRLFSGEEVSFTPKDNRLTVKWDRSNHKLPVFDASEYPVIERPQADLVTLNGTVLSKAIQRALRCISSDAKDFWMQGVSLCSRDGKLYVAATNSRHFAVTEIDTLLDLEVLLPVKAATVLSKMLDGEIQVGASQNQIVFRQGSKIFTARLMDAKFPDWRPIVPAGFKHSIALDPEIARQAFRLASVTARETQLIALPFRLSLSGSEMEIQTEETERGKSSETISIECATLNGETLSRGINGQHFLGFLEEDQEVLMSFNDDMRIIQLAYEAEPNYRYLTMALKA